MVCPGGQVIALLLTLASASELAPYGRVDLDVDGLHLAGAVSSVLSPNAYLYTGLTWQDGIDPLGARFGLGRPHADLGIVTELGALQWLNLVGAGWDGWRSAPLIVGRSHLVIELPPLPFLLENRFQLEASLGQRLDVENRTVVLYRLHPVGLGVQVEPGWTKGEPSRFPLGLRANVDVDGTSLGLFAGWDVSLNQPAARFTAVVRF